MDEPLLPEDLAARTERAAVAEATYDDVLAERVRRHHRIGRAGVRTASAGLVAIGAGTFAWVLCVNNDELCTTSTALLVGGVGALAIGEGLTAWGGIALGHDVDLDPRLGYVGAGLFVAGFAAFVPVPGFSVFILAWPAGLACSALHFGHAAAWARDLELVPTGRGVAVTGRW